ncbi:tRNA-specific 2-thiouridylase MnmA [Desulforhabdus sp. TSK]|nr:tRNA-specific 2-thiouridylase MnmA [Desulforhabdus sp. TSK]
MRVAVAMSGGVDSLRTAILLKESGADVFGIHMRLVASSRAGDDGGASSVETDQYREEAIRDLCSRMEISLFVIDMRERFEASVIQPFLRSYLDGLTPNPCVVCNPTIKFGHLMEEARRRGADRLATGHYARILPPDSESKRFRLCRGLDPVKDQSYFLYGMTQQQLASTVFPLGASTKQQVMRWAEQAGLAHSLPRESQEICFIPSGSYHEFLKERVPSSAMECVGPICDLQGNCLGEHKGIYAYTVGQRRGLGIASTAPYYVVALEPATRTVRVGRSDDLLCRECTVSNVNWVSIPAPGAPLRAEVRIRHQHIPAPALLTPTDNSTLIVRFENPQRAVTPGQAAVFYQGDVVLGGGTLSRRNV